MATITTGSRRRRRTTLVLATTTAVLGGLTSALPPAALAATVDTSASYVLVNRNSGKALDVYDLATNDGARISQYTRNDGAWQ
ncbi:RICIN domain-containing protein, partial [Saccharothrix longispora]